MKNLLFNLIIIFSLFIISCDLQYGTCDEDNIKIGNIYNYSFSGSEEIPEFETIDTAMTWVDNYLKKQDTYESADYWQSPEESFYAQTGDCEDHCILFMFILKKQFNIDSDMCILHQLMGYHAIVYIPSIDEYYDVTNDHIHSNPELAKKQTERQYTYSQTLWIAINYHTDINL